MRAHSTEKRYALRPIPATRSRSDSQSSQPFAALPERSWKTVGVTFSRNHVSLSTLSPSFW